MSASRDRITPPWASAVTGIDAAISSSVKFPSVLKLDRCVAGEMIPPIMICRDNRKSIPAASQC